MDGEDACVFRAMNFGLPSERKGSERSSIRSDDNTSFSVLTRERERDVLVLKRGFLLCFNGRTRVEPGMFMKPPQKIHGFTSNTFSGAGTAFAKVPV